jgi:hypothetical protein
VTISRILLLAALGAGLLAPPAAARPGRGDAERAFEAMREGRSMPLPLIEQRVVPKMRDQGAQYLGPEFRGRTYRLKFVSGMRVIWVDVDAATGRVINSKR